MIVRILGAQPDLDVVAVCADGQEAIDAVPGAAPEVIVMDLLMPGMDGAAAAAEILRGHPDLRIWLYTETPHDPRVRAAVAAGAAGVLPKDGNPRTLLAAVRSDIPPRSPGPA